MFRTSFEGVNVRYAPSLRSIVESHVDDGVILVAAERKEMAMGVSWGVLGDCWVSEARWTSVPVIGTPWIGLGKRARVR